MNNYIIIHIISFRNNIKNYLKEAKEKLLASSQQLFTKMYEQAQAQANANAGQAGPDMGGFNGGANYSQPEQDPNPSPEGDVVDGDFKEI